MKIYFLKEKKHFWIAAALVLAILGMGLRAPMLDRASPWEDDYSNFDRADMSLPELFAIQKYQGPADTIFDIHPPLSYVAFKAAFAVDRSALAARCVSLLASAVAIFAIFLLGRALLGDLGGMLAALLATLSIEHIYLSRIIKTYSLFFTCIILAAWLLVRALQDNRLRYWCGYVLCSVAMLYAGYQGVVILAGFSIYGVWWLLPDLRGGRFRSSGERTVRFAASTLAVGLLFLPWIPAVFFLKKFLAKPGIDPLSGLDFAFAIKIFKGFLAADFEASGVWLIVWGVAAVLGIISCLVQKKHAALFLLLTCSAMNIGALVFSQTRLRPLLEHRHFIFVYLAWILFAAQGTAEAGGQLSRFVRTPSKRPVAVIVFGALLCLGLSAPGFSQYEQVYSWNLTRHRELFQWLAFHKNNIQALDFYDDKRNMMAFAARWHLPGFYQEAGTWEAPGYRRAYFYWDVSPEEAAKPRDLPGAEVLRASDGKNLIRLNSVGLVNGAPLVPFPDKSGHSVFAEDFTTFSFFETCQSAVNMKLDLSLGMLRPSRYSRPASATWAFDFSTAPPPKSLRLVLSAILYKQVMDIPSDATMVIQVSGDGENYAVLKEIDSKSFTDVQPCPSFDQIDFFDGRCHTAEAAFALDPAMPAKTGRLYVRVAYKPGTREGYVGLGALRLEVDSGAPGTTEDAGRAFARRLDNLLRNNGVIKWVQGHVSVGQGLYAFVAPDCAEPLAKRAELGSPDVYAAYLAAHPGEKPVFVLRDDQGRPAVCFHDPSLADPGLSVGAKTPEVAFTHAGTSPFTPGALLFSGRFSAPAFELGGKHLELPVIAPEGSILSVNEYDPGGRNGRDGRARLRFVSNWSRPGALKDAFYAENVHAVRGQDDSRLEMATDGYGALIWQIVSALPMTEVRIGFYASVYGEPCSKCAPNSLRFSVATDGGDARLVEEIRGEVCEWSPKYRLYYHRFVFDKPVRMFRAQFELYGKAGNVQLITFDDPLYPSSIECELDARVLSGSWPTVSPALGRIAFSGDSKNDFKVYFEPSPMPSFRELYPTW